MATKSSAIVQTMIGVVNTKRRPSRSARAAISAAPCRRSTAPEVRIATSAKITARKDSAFSR